MVIVFLVTVNHSQLEAAKVLLGAVQASCDLCIVEAFKQRYSNRRQEEGHGLGKLDAGHQNNSCVQIVCKFSLQGYVTSDPLQQTVMMDTLCNHTHCLATPPKLNASAQ